MNVRFMPLEPMSPCGIALKRAKGSEELMVARTQNRLALKYRALFSIEYGFEVDSSFRSCWEQ